MKKAGNVAALHPPKNLIFNTYYKVMKIIQTKVNFPQEMNRLFRSFVILVLILSSFMLQSFITIDDTKVTINVKNVSIEQVLWKLKEQTKIEFVYGTDDLKAYKNVSLNMVNKSLKSVLDNLFTGTDLKYEISKDVIVITKRAPEEIRKSGDNKKFIKGTVKDSSGEPLPGASILIVGTTLNYFTDIDGKFQIESDKVNPQSILRVTYIGMKSDESALGARRELNIVLNDMAQQIGEVMVVAYGVVKKEAYTGSASVVKGEQIMKEASPLSAEKALQGYVAGVRVTQTDGQPGAKATIQIRGIGSINGNLEPLYVIDGVPMVSGDVSQLISSNVMTALNPDDIESMTVLKDAAATSLYGSRAANGVIIITTKQGKAGKTIFSVDYEHGWTKTAMRHELFGEYLNGKQYTEYALEGLKNRYLYDRKALPGQANYVSGNSALQEEAMNYAYSNLNSKAKVIHPDDKLDGTFKYSTADRDKYMSNARNTDWARELFKSGKEDKLNLSARGGNDKMKFFTSLGYYSQVGLLPSSRFERYTGKISIDNTVSDFFSFSINESVAYTDQSGTSSGGYYSNPIWGIKNLNPTAPVSLESGEFYKYPGFSSKIPNYVKNVQEEVKKSTNFRSITNLTATANITKWLTFRTVNGLDYINLAERSEAGIDSHDGRNEKGDLAELFTKILDMTTSNTFSFNKSFAKHKISAVMGYEAKKYHYKYFYGEGTGFISDKFLELDNAAQAIAVGGSFNDDRLVSYFVKGDYNYNDRYYFSLSYRRDGSSRLAQEERWGNFYAVSGAWDLTKSSFIKNIKWINSMRLKSSYGTTGNLPTNLYASQSLFSFSNRYNGDPVFFLSNVGNPKLTWEHSYTFNIGVDFSLLNARLQGGLEYYNKITDNLLNNAAVSANTGFSSILVNEGKLANNGVELSLASRNIVKNDFKWSTDLNISWMSAKVKDLANDVISSPLIFREGENLFSFYGREWAGVNKETGEPMWYVNEYEADGKTPKKERTTTNDPAKANQVILTKAYPNLYGGITNRFSYKGIELSFLFTFTLGGHMYHNLDRNSADGKYIGTYNPTKRALEGVWRQPGDDASKPLVIYGNPYLPETLSDRYILSTDHLRLKNLTISYNLPKNFVKKMKLANCKIYFNGTDLFTLFKYNDINPEVSYSGYTNAGSRYPALKSFRLGVNLQF
jgi:TonB-linked SusC/RagA family outer membrane protein